MLRRDTGTRRAGHAA